MKKMYRPGRSARTLAAALLSVGALTAGCAANSAQSGTPTAQSQPAVTESEPISTSPTQEVGGLTVEGAMESNHAYWTVDEEIQSAQERETITLSGQTASSSSSQVTVNGTNVTITGAGVYEVSGTFAGQLVVDAGDDAQVSLILAGANITNQSGPALHLESADGVYIELTEGTENSLEDRDEYAEDADANAALFSRVDMQVGGTGSLTVTGNGEDGIASKDDLVISGGTVTVNALDDGLRGKDALVITGGTISVTSGGDGLKTTNADEEDRGYFLITGGNVTVAAGDDGIDSVRDAMFAGGNVTVTQSVEGVEAQNILIGGGTLSVTASDDGLNATNEISATQAGEFGDDGSQLVIYGGTVTVTAEGDGIDSNGSLTVSGGELTVFGPSRSIKRW